MSEKKVELLKKKNELRKLLKEKGVLERDKKNTFDNYKYFSEAQYKKLFTELFSKVGLELAMSVEELQTFNVEGSKQPNGRIVKVLFTLQDTDTGDEEQSIVFGEGFDKGDKGIYKAYTGALKYYLANTFMVATGDDPENESPEGTKEIVFENEEMKLGTYRSYIDNYFAQYPAQKEAFLKKYKITKLDDLDTKVKKEKIDKILTGLKLYVAEDTKQGIYSEEMTF